MVATDAADTPSLRDVTAVVTEPQTYKNALYLALAFPLGVAYFVALTVGLALGIGLAFVLVGILILLTTVLGSRFLAAFERWLANALLDVTVSPPDGIPASAGSWSTLEAYLGAASTWKGFAFLYLKYWIGLFGFVVLVVAVSLTVALITAPLHYTDPTIGVTGVWTIDTLPEALLAVPVGVAVGILSLYLLNALARVSGWIALALLGAEGGAREGETVA